MRISKIISLRRAFAWALLTSLVYAGGIWVARAGPETASVLRVNLKGAINPAMARYIIRGIEQAEEEGDQALIIQMYTPGGLDTSMRDIISKILASRVPVVTYVAPDGARAASAGAIIALASHVIAMAPATNIGAAHPVEVTGQYASEKVVNDSAAYAKFLAKRRGRNVQWAEMAVRKAISNTAEEAKAKNVVDIIAPDTQSLLNQLDGREIRVAARTVVLRTRFAPVRDLPMNAAERFLHIIADPNVAYILMLIAIYGIIAELNNPGAVFPGVVGAIALVMAFYAFAVLPTNVAGLLLIALSVALFITDVFVPSHGALTVGGIVSFALGSFMLFERGSPAFSISISLLISGVVVTSVFFAVIVGTGLRSLRNPVVTGVEGLVGKTGTARTDVAPEGKVFVDGAYWNARVEGDHLETGDKCAVLAVEGFTLVVRKKLET